MFMRITRIVIICIVTLSKTKYRHILLQLRCETLLTSTKQQVIKEKLGIPTDSEQYLTQHACCASDLCDNFSKQKNIKLRNFGNKVQKLFQTMMTLTIRLNVAAFLFFSVLFIARSLVALQAPTSSWGPFRP